MKISVCIPHLNNITPQTYQSLGILLEMKEYQFDFHECISSNIAHSRNELIRLSKDSPRILFIDSDNYFTKEQIMKLLKYNQSIVGGAYPCQGFPEKIVGGHWGNVTGMPVLLPKSSTGLRKVDMLGMGCCLIKTEVFKKIKGPFFCHETIKTPKGDVVCNEDIGFFLKCERAGIPLYLDCDLQIGHVLRTIEKRNIIERINIHLKKSEELK